MSDLPDLSDARLVVIDPQRIFADSGSEWGSPMFDAALGPIKSLRSGFGADRTIVTRWLPGTDRDGSRGPYFERWSFADKPDTDPLFDLVSPANGWSSRGTVDVSTFGKWGPGLTRLTGAAPTLVLAGVSTDCCVISTALPAADAGATIVVAADACAGSSEDNHAAALQVMGLYAPQIEVVSSAEVPAAR
ncbi:cysteine hydrolase [Janibacter limosus]|uniref:cysteine hydrolase family protein n=1 Tax=Janibacter limosus TaxID=53458 RepID=UPI002152C782|nr:cysteine hydrolase [Janibacter limosus]UUZ46350.2 cysteine hydrolase [Janibacter limosus]